MSRTSSNKKHFSLMMLWRLIATGFCFAFFSLGGFFFAITFLATIKAIYKDPKEQKVRVQKAISSSFRFFVRMMEFLGVINFESLETDKLKGDDGVIYVANHPSLIDVVLMGATVERFDCIVKASLWDNPLTKWVVRAADFVPNTAAVSVIDDCIQRLQTGGILIIFPEGTRTVPGQELKLQRSAAQIAVRSKAPVRLLHIHSKPNHLTKADKWYNVPDRKPLYQLKAGELIDTAAFCEAYPEHSLAARKLTRHIKEKLEQGLTEFER